jgi:hypothetical protein
MSLFVLACSGGEPAPEVMVKAVAEGRALLEAAPVDAAPAPVEPAPIAAPAAEAPARARLMLTLRSTPAGAAVSLDGRLVGTTPHRVEVADDGRERDFSFVLAGHEPWRLRFAPAKDGVIHATLRPRPRVGRDAGG